MKGIHQKVLIETEPDTSASLSKRQEGEEVRKTLKGWETTVVCPEGHCGDSMSYSLQWDQGDSGKWCQLSQGRGAVGYSRPTTRLCQLQEDGGPVLTFNSCGPPWTTVGRPLSPCLDSQQSAHSEHRLSALDTQDITDNMKGLFTVHLPTFQHL